MIIESTPPHKIILQEPKLGGGADKVGEPHKKPECALSLILLKENTQHPQTHSLRSRD